MQVKSTSRPILLWLLLCSSSASAGRRVSIHLPQHEGPSSLCIPNPLLSSASNRGIITSDFFTCREFLSDVPSDFEGFVSVGTPAACLRNPDLDAAAERRIDNAGGEGESPRLGGGIAGALRAVRRRADSRAELARTLFERRRRTLNTAAHLAADAARSSPAGRLLSRTASVYSARDAHLTTIRNRVALPPRRGGHQQSGGSSPSSSSRHNYANSILTEEERAALVERTSRLLDSVRRALAQKHLWEEVTERDGVKVWRTHADVKNLPSDGSPHVAASDGATILSEAYMNASPRDVYELFMNDDRVHEYNDNCVSLADIEKVDESTKINWCATGKFGPFKARDFVTLVHFRKLSDEEGYLSLAANVEHSKLPPADGFVRSQIQLSATFMRPVPGEPNKTQFIQMTQVGQLGGVADSAMAKRITANLAEKAPVDFMRKFDAALSRSTPAPRPKARAANNRLPFSGVGSLSQV